jgi:hypothetical protein
LNLRSPMRDRIVNASDAQLNGCGIAHLQMKAQVEGRERMRKLQNADKCCH